jgi:hypothetical protein
MQISITHHPQSCRFEVQVEGYLCVLNYQLHEGIMTIVHTGVPAEVGGRGIAAELTRVALETARVQGWRVAPLCSYAVAYLKRHPEYGELKA